MAKQTIGPTLSHPDGIVELRLTLRVASGKLEQCKPQSFFFYTEKHPDVLGWIDECHHDHTVSFSDCGQFCLVEFDTKTGAMDFKLRWM